MRQEGGLVADITPYEVALFEVHVLVQQHVVHAHGVPGGLQLIGQPTTDVAGASDDQDVAHLSPWRGTAGRPWAAFILPASAFSSGDADGRTGRRDEWTFVATPAYRETS